MNPMKKRIQEAAILIALCLVAGTAVAAETKDAPPAAAPAAVTAEAAKPAPAAVSPDEPAAKVNGTVITRGDVARTMKALLAQNPQGQNLPPELMKQAEETTLENLISAELLYQAGTKLEIKDLDKQVEEKYRQSKSRFPSATDFEKALKSAGLTEKELTEFTRKDIVINNLIQKEVAPKVVVSDEEAKKFYDENLDRFKQPESVKASHILVGVDPKATAEEKQKAKEKAEALLKKVKAGEDFAALAKKESTCPSSAQGGDLGFFTKGQMVAPFEKAAFGLKTGDVSDVVETQFGYHVIKVTDRKDGETTKFDEVKEKIKEYLKGQKMQKAVTAYIAELKTTEKVEKVGK
jgi:peptidyl-prolyl cis-trans isomerase C